MTQLKSGHRSRALRAKIRLGRTPGMAFLELLIVVAIFGLLASVIVMAVMNQFENAKIKVTRHTLYSVEEALIQYGKKHGYPNQGEGLGVLVSPPGGEAPYLKEAPKDSWKKDILYFNPARRGSAPFEVVSMGPDGNEGTKDDIYARGRKKPR